MHWNPEGELARPPRAHELPPGKPAWPKGATAGLVLVAACCLSIGLALYEVAGPRDVVVEDIVRR
jgi:hypothetical protein